MKAFKETLPAILFLFISLVLSIQITCAQGGLTPYGSIPDYDGYGSVRYSVQVREVDAMGNSLNDYQYNHTYYLESIANSGADRMSHSHWTTFSFEPKGSSAMVEVEVTLNTGSISTYEFRPTHVSNIIKSGSKITFQIESNKYAALIINNDIRNPLFVFCDPAETNVPDTTLADVFIVRKGSTTKEDPLTIRDIGTKKIVYFEKGEHFINEQDAFGYTPQNTNLAFFVCKNDGTRANNNQIAQIYIPGGALVHGNIRATRANGLMVNGRGIIEGEDTYGYASGDYFSSQILSSAINMAAYRDKTGARPATLNQVVDGITSILPRKYNIQLGIGAVVKNTKCFAYHQTTDGIGVEENSTVSNNFIKVNDDALKLYQDNCVFENTYIWHQMNGAAMQLGWDKEEGDDILVKNTYLLHDDMYQAGYFNEGFWANQSIICWLKHYETFDPTRENIVIDGINANNMPLVGVVRVLAIAMDGALGGSGSGNLDMTLKNVIVGKENEKTPSYIGCAADRYANVEFINAKRNGVCMDESNVPARGNTDGVTITSDYCGGSYHTITVSTATGGRISPSTSTVTEGNDVTFTILPDEGWNISDVVVDGVSQGSIAEYTFTNVMADHSISARFVNPLSIENSNNSLVRIYPNPVSEILFFEFAHESTENTIEIFNLLGELVFSRTTQTQNIQININEIDAKGFVLIKTMTTERNLSVHRIFVQ